MVLLLFFKTLLPKDIEYVSDHDSYPKKNQHLWRKTRHASSPVDVVRDLRPCLIKRKTTLFLYNGCSIQENEQEEQIVCVRLRVAWIEL